MRQTIPDTPPDFDAARIIERPDGFYLQSIDGKDEYGPYATLLEAEQALSEEDLDASIEPESLEEAEQELGISDWIDPDTGLPGEDGSARIEEH